MPGIAPDAEFESLLEHLRRSRGVDFTAYKRPSLMRRVSTRMRTIGVRRYGEYQQYLDAHAEEVPRLVGMLLIGFTGFFRDPGAWEHVRETVIPALVESSGDEPIRCWSAGCASGEEAYTVAMLLAERLGPEAYGARVRIDATDVNEASLRRGRSGVYPVAAVEAVPEGLRERYFAAAGGGGLALDPAIRRGVRLARHDLVRDEPMAGADLVVCRNTLMYLGPSAQARILTGFGVALRPGGFLFLGMAETVCAAGGPLSPSDPKWRVFVKAAPIPIREDAGRERNSA